MFNIEELLNLFEDENVKKIILSSYLFSQRQNNELSDRVFQQLLYLKTLHPNLRIEVNYMKNDTSNYNHQTNTINLNRIFDETTFLHELTHMFSYHYSQFVVPQEFYDFKSKFLSTSENDSLVISLLDLCEKEKQKAIKTTSSIEIKNDVNKDLSDSDVETHHDYFIICKIEDIIDSIYSGTPHTTGLTSLKDSNSFAEKSPRSAGHGCDYFNKTGYEFEEIIADYQAIKLINPNNQLFVLLKQIIGDNFISFLDERCQLINGEKIIAIENNNSFYKK